MSEYKPASLNFEAHEPVSGIDTSLCPVVFLHGLTASGMHWAAIPQLISNETKRKVYVLDARNHGDSEWTDDFSFDIVAKDLLYFLDSQKIYRAVLIGHSMGGIASMLVALAKPERVDKLVIEDIVLKQLPRESVGLLTMFMQLLQDSVTAIPEGASEEEARKSIISFIQSRVAEIEKSPEFQKLPEGQKHVNIDGPFLNLRKGDDGRYNFKSNFKVLQGYINRIAAGEKWNEPKGTYDGDALFIYGSMSQIQVGKDKDLVKRNFPSASFYEIEGASHSVHQDNPNEFTDQVLRFLS